MSFPKSFSEVLMNASRAEEVLLREEELTHESEQGSEQGQNNNYTTTTTTLFGARAGAKEETALLCWWFFVLGLVVFGSEMVCCFYQGLGLAVILGGMGFRVVAAWVLLSQQSRQDRQADELHPHR